jgi:hypothetical protein
MSSKGQICDGSNKFLFLITVEDANFIVRTKIPWRWVVGVVVAWGALTGSPQIIQILAEAFGG